MTDTKESPTVGIVVTIRDIHEKVTTLAEQMVSTMQELKDEANKEYTELREKISSLKAQIAALYVTHGLVIAFVLYLSQKGLTP